MPRQPTTDYRNCLLKNDHHSPIRGLLRVRAVLIIRQWTIGAVAFDSFQASLADIDSRWIRIFQPLPDRLRSLIRKPKIYSRISDIVRMPFEHDLRIGG